jgi:phage shock protein E
VIRVLACSVILSACAHSPIAVQTEGAFLLDVRSPGEFAEGHLKGAVNVPVNELEATLSSLPTDRNRQILLYGAQRSKARGVLLKAGYSKVNDVQ